MSDPRTELIYGRRPVEEAQSGRRRVLRTWEAPSTAPEELERLAGSPDHQGLIAEVEAYPYAAPESLLGEQGLLIALDQVQDPRNLGAVARSAEVAGASGLVIPERRAAGVSAACCKASAGAVEHLPIARARNLAEWLLDARKAGFWIWGAAADAPAGHTEADLTGPTVLVLGGEAKGLRPRVAESCDGLISIPRHGRIESLNISAAASALLFEAVRQRYLAG